MSEAVPLIMAQSWLHGSEIADIKSTYIFNKESISCHFSGGTKISNIFGFN